MSSKPWRLPLRALLLWPVAMLAWACPSSEPASPSQAEPAREGTEAASQQSSRASHASEEPSDTAPRARRIAVMAPAAAEMLDVLGRLDQAVGVGDFVQWPPAVQSLPRLGPFHAPNTERVLGLRVDLLVTSHSEAARASLGRLEDLGVEVLALRTDTYDGVLRSLRALGRTLDAEERARAAVARIRARVTAVKERAAEAPRRRVLVVVGREPLYVAGPGSHFDELIEAAGGKNIASDALSPYQLVSLEAMLERRPEVIIEIAASGPDGPRGRTPGAWAKWPFLPAVAQERVFWVDPLRLSIPGPRLADMAETMGKLIHPEIFGEPSAAALGPPDGAGDSGKSP